MDSNEKSKYEKIYTDTKRDILTGKLKDGEKLLSKRGQASRLGVSVITVENAYSRLVAEGYITAKERSGYYVCAGDISAGTPREMPQPVEDVPSLPEEEPATDSSIFPFSVWTRLMRTVILEKGSGLLSPVPAGGAPELRRAVSAHLRDFRGINVPPRQIIIGAGSEYLNDILVKLLGSNLTYAVENPGYQSPAQIYRLNGALCLPVGLDDKGISARELYYKNIDVAHISPAHHFPTGAVMPVSRRMELIKWAEQRNAYIIEDDYDSEFRTEGKPVPAMFGADFPQTGRVIYMNTFSMTIAPSVRIGYICLPPELYERWQENMGFIISCPVPAFEQYTLARFISGGYFERHIRRLRRHYRLIRESALLLAEKYCGGVAAGSAGLHFSLEIPSGSPLFEIYKSCGVRLSPLGQYYDKGTSIPPESRNKYVVSFARADEVLLKKYAGE